ncbi:hypothetical protein [Streptomyces sp. NPDC101393]|uniref:hypothetical protein n=1 Tax=Streptomyces sp. NPDC101393 TaxID=3366141 RepID=UPI0038237497
MITIGCMDCGVTVLIKGRPLVDGFFTCPVCRENAGVEIVDARPLPDFVVVEKALSVRASNFYVYDNTAGRMLTQFAYGRHEDAQADADSRMPSAPETVAGVVTPSTTCPSLAQPGNIHFMLVHCIECNSHRMAKMSRDTVERWYRSGHFNQDEYEGFMHVWATSAVRHSVGAWVEAPTIPEVTKIVAAIRRFAGIPIPVGLAA